MAGGYPVADVVESVCVGCAGRAFRVLADDNVGCVQRICVNCARTSYIADSDETQQDADLRPCQCPCGGEAFGVAVGFARRPDQDIRWISVGLRCLGEGTLGVCASWQIGYSPTAHLLTKT